MVLCNSLVGAESHLGCGDTSTFVLPSAAIVLTARTALPVQLLQRAHKDSDHTDAYVPKLTVLSAVIIFLVFPLAASDRLSVVATWHMRIFSLCYSESHSGLQQLPGVWLPFVM